MGRGCGRVLGSFFCYFIFFFSFLDDIFAVIIINFFLFNVSSFIKSILFLTI